MVTALEIGQKIEALRRARALTQTQLATLLCVSPQAVGKWERGESMPDILMFIRLSEVLGTDLNDFGGLAPDAPSAPDAPPTAEQAGQTEPQRRPWNMSGAIWADADFSGLAGLGEKFSGSNLNNCSFVRSDLSGLRLSGNTMHKNNFSASSFRSSTLKGSTVSGNTFCDCLFQHTVLSGNTVKDCDFTGADFTDAEIKYSQLSKLAIDGAVWLRTAFRHSQLSGMTFSGAITDCSFTHCNFSRVTFQNATLTGCFFKGGSVKKIRFSDCTADRLTYAFLQNCKAELTGIGVIP